MYGYLNGNFTFEVFFTAAEVSNVENISDSNAGAFESKLLQEDDN